MTRTTLPATTSPAAQRRTLALWAAYVFFVVYGSLVPLDFAPLPLAQAWERFAQIRMLALGAESRADWIANGVLYFPLGFLSWQLFGGGSRLRRGLAYALAAAFCAALAGGVEFAQIYFPPRTVSQNDIAAEIIGSVLGLALAGHASSWFASLLDAASGRLWPRLLEGYIAGYVALSLFPYDVLLSGTELAAKIDGPDWGWLIAGDPHGALRIALKALIELLFALPFGVFLGARRAPRRPSYTRAALTGLAFGASIEIAQFFTVSGLAQGLSVLTRSAGFCVGLALWQRRDSFSPQRVRAWLGDHAAILAALYLVALPLANGWLTNDWSGIDHAFARIATLHFLPFYYHYFTTEMHALISLSMTCLIYAPIGVLVWARYGSARQALLLAALAAFVGESGKLFIDTLRPDPTNLLLAAASAWACVHLARLLASPARPATPDTPLAPLEAPPQPPETADASRAHARARRAGARPGLAGYALVAVPLAGAAYWAAIFPSQAWLICLLLAASAALLWFRPAWCGALIVAALPIVDLAPWSGRFFLDEYDLLLTVCLVVAALRTPAPPRARRARRLTPFALAAALLGISLAVSAARGLLPLPPLDANAFNSYLSPFNALRIAKGGIWALLVAGLLRRQLAAGYAVRAPLAWGLTAGLAATVAVVCWERVAFSGLWNFAADYRVTGPFSAMHTGGAYIECFLSCATPFAVVLLLRERNWLIKAAAALLLLATTYALMVTFSRNGYLAFAVALALMFAFAVLRGAARWRRALLAAGVGVALLAVALPVFKGEFAQNRIATLAQDLTVRQNHWADALGMRSAGWATTFFGMGLGSYPRSHYLTSREGGRSGSYRLGEDDGSPYLRLVSGSSIYVEQLLALDLPRNYRLTLDFRTDRPKTSLTVPVCEKWLLTSYNCRWLATPPSAAAGLWQHYEARVDTRTLRRSAWYARRPIKLAFYNGETNAVIDVAKVRLENDAGQDMLRNGDFAHGLDQWFFSADSHLQWHTKSLPVAALFDQGWFGVFAWGLFALSAIVVGARRAWNADLDAAAALAALVAFLVVGAFDTLIDAPRFLLLVLLLGSLCALQPAATPNESR